MTFVADSLNAKLTRGSDVEISANITIHNPMRLLFSRHAGICWGGVAIHLRDLIQPSGVGGVRHRNPRLQPGSTSNIYNNILHRITIAKGINISLPEIDSSWLTQFVDVFD